MANPLAYLLQQQPGQPDDPRERAMMAAADDPVQPPLPAPTTPLASALGPAPTPSTRGFSPFPQGVVGPNGRMNPGEYDFPTDTADPRFADARANPIATPDADHMPGAPMWTKAPSAAAMTAPTPATQSTSNPALRALAPSAYQQGVGGPPHVSEPSAVPGIVGNVLQILLNRGDGRRRSIADIDQRRQNQLGALMGLISPQKQDVDYTNYQRDMQDAKDRAGIQAQLTHAAGNPEANDLRRLEIANAQTRAQALMEEQKTRTAEIQRKAQLEKDANDPNSERSKYARGLLVSAGVDPKMLDGVPEAVLNKSPAAAKLLERGMAQFEIDQAAKKAGAVSDAQFGNEAKLAGIRADNQAALEAQREAAAKDLAAQRADAGKSKTLGGTTPDEILSSVEQQYPWMHLTAKPLGYRWAANSRALGTVNQDFQNADQLHMASQDMSKVREELAAGPADGEDPDDFLARINTKWDFAKEKATGALAALGGSNSLAALDHAEKLWPRKLNPYAAPALAGAQEEIDHVLQSRIGILGYSVRGSAVDQAHEKAPKAAPADKPAAHRPVAPSAPTVTAKPVADDELKDL